VASGQWPVTTSALLQPVYQADTSATERLRPDRFPSPGWKGQTQIRATV